MPNRRNLREKIFVLTHDFRGFIPSSSDLMTNIMEESYAILGIWEAKSKGRPEERPKAQKEDSRSYPITYPSTTPTHPELFFTYW